MFLSVSNATQKQLLIRYLATGLLEQSLLLNATFYHKKRRLTAVIVQFTIVANLS